MSTRWLACVHAPREGGYPTLHVSFPLTVHKCTRWAIRFLPLPYRILQKRCGMRGGRGGRKLRFLRQPSACACVKSVARFPRKATMRHGEFLLLPTLHGFLLAALIAGDAALRAIAAIFQKRAAIRRTSRRHEREIGREGHDSSRGPHRTSDLPRDLHVQSPVHAACGAISFRTFFHGNDADTTTAEHAKKGGPFSPIPFVVGPSVLKCPLKRSLLDYRLKARFICLQNRALCALDFACMS